MKKLLILIFLTVTIILLGGCFVKSNEEDFNNNTILKAEKTIESYLSNNFKNIHTITFKKNDYSTPMGGMVISGTVNNNEKATFSIDVDYENDFKIISSAVGKEFPERKEECKEKTCDY
ncbi:Protein of unknown function [Virgibacillus chiguensis]|uniref:DUF1433 domain-containing protein n=1 Tax=Virgibacillus chiguensis TaxID=411959 RepID=A0A1M5XR94_9BACI|nr:Protein of unknown function [Virgibacillus chiguensis]